MASKLPSSLKLTELKKLAVACGLPSSGTKSVLSGRLLAALPDQRQLKAERPTKRRVLSVDLGIRNLAFALLTAPSPSKASTTERHAPPSSTVEVWKRVALATPVDEVKQDAEPDMWSPSSMADMTLKLVQEQFLAMNPTHILIERQRFRSGGQAAVQEWTLRVNTLEAMLYATLRTLKQSRVWTGELHAIPPARVGPFWLQDAVESEETKEAKPTSKSAKARNKKAKIDLVAKWLLDGRPTMVKDAGDTAVSYLYRWRGGRKTKAANSRESAGEHFDKLDDLADCLLQGLAWSKWEENKRLLAQHGAYPLLG